MLTRRDFGLLAIFAPLAKWLGIQPADSRPAHQYVIVFHGLITHVGRVYRVSD